MSNRIKNTLSLTAWVILALVACSSPTPAPTAPPDTQATVNAAIAATNTAQQSIQATIDAAVQATHAAAPTVPPASATSGPSQPTVAPKGTPTTAPTIIPTVAPTATRAKAVVPPKPTSAGPLEFTLEFGQSAPRKGDLKVQLTVILHITGGTPPFQVVEDVIPQTITKTVDGVLYVRDWHDCSPAEPHTIMLISADGQQSSQSIMLPYSCQ